MGKNGPRCGVPCDTASERRCAILVHSVQQRSRSPTLTQRAPNGPPNEDKVVKPNGGLRVCVSSFASLRPLKQLFGRQRPLPKHQRFSISMSSSLLKCLILIVASVAKTSGRLSGTESAILNRESSDSESCDSIRAIPRSLYALIGCDSDGDSESIFRYSTLLRFNSFFCFSHGVMSWTCKTQQTSPSRYEFQYRPHPKDPAVLKTLRVVNHYGDSNSLLR